MMTIVAVIIYRSGTNVYQDQLSVYNSSPRSHTVFLFLCQICLQIFFGMFSTIIFVSFLHELTKVTNPVITKTVISRPCGT